MPDRHDELKEQLDLLESLSFESSSDEKVDSLWRHLMVYKAFADNDLADSKARRAKAEAAREQAEREAIEATRALCERMRAEAARELQEAKNINMDAAKVRQEAEGEYMKARDVRERAEADAANIIAEAQRKAEEIQEQARRTAHREITELRRQALKEIKLVLTRLEDMRAAADEELETQRILTNITRLKATSRWFMAETSYPESEAEASAPSTDPFKAEANGSASEPEAKRPAEAGAKGSHATGHARERKSADKA